MSKETIGAKIRNRLSPYKFIIEIATNPNYKFTPEQIKKELSKPIHRACLEELIALSKECEHEASISLENQLYNEKD